MYDKRMLIVPASLAKKIDENRGDLTQLEFIDFLIESHLQRESKQAANPEQYVTKEDLQAFEEGIKALLRNFLEFFISYGLELGKQPGNERFAELDQKLKGLGGTFSIHRQGEKDR